MPPSSSRIVRLIEAQLERLSEPTRADLEGVLRWPVRMDLGWNYGSANQRLECWHVGESMAKGVRLIYSERGFGPDCPWGYVSRAEDSMGMDSQWHVGLADAAIGAGILAAPAGYEVPGPTQVTSTQNELPGRSLVVFVDVDDTLIRSAGGKRIPITSVVEHVRGLSHRGATLYCWSSGGTEYARTSAAELNLEQCFSGYLPKPNVLIDDQSMTEWRRFLWFHPNEAISRTPDEYAEMVFRVGATGDHR